jgi:hypothetical protein
LEYVDATVVPTATGIRRLQTVRYNALRTRSTKANIERFGRVDILYSAGLCDYLSDDLLIALLSAWRQSLDIGGVLYLAFKDADLYDKTPYQWHLDWFFYQRSEEDCWRLFRSAGFDIGAMHLTRDATGIIMNFISRADSRSIVRVDEAADDRLQAPHATDRANVNADHPLSQQE